MRDLILTWPKATKLSVYLETLKQAHARMDVINFRVGSPPLIEDNECERVYMVHDGKIRGWSAFLGVEFRKFGEVKQARGDGYWPEGWYIVRSALWHPLENEVEMRGFQGFRYMRGNREAVV